MSAFSSSDPGRSPRGLRTIWASFIATVVVPVASMLVIWGLLLAGVLGGALGNPAAPARHHQDLAGVFLVAGTGLVIIVISVALMGLSARRIARDIGGLEATAGYLASEEMPQLVEKLRRGEQVTAAEAIPATRAVTAEVAHAETAIASLAAVAAAAAAAEASLRNGTGQVFVSLARRYQSLLQRQRGLIEALGQKASGPATLADLSPLDHLTTRMRRNAESLIILSGAAAGRSLSLPVPVIDVIRGAVAEVEDYQRVTVLTRAGDAVAGQAVPDMIHLLAELIENATLSSPAGAQVEVRAERVANGFAIEVDDRGQGIEAGQLAAINAQLAGPPGSGLASADQLGLLVVAKLAARHGVRVALRPSHYGGTTAVVLMPDNIVVPLNATGAPAQPDPGHALGQDGDPGLPAAGALALPGRDPAPPLAASGTSPAGTGETSLDPVTAGSGPGPGTGTGPFATGLPPGPPAPGPRPDVTHRGLPRRVRQGSLSPHLRESPPAAARAAQADGAAPASGRSPEQVRDLLSSLQRGLQRGRRPHPSAQATDGTDAAAADEPGARGGADAPQNGEA